MKQLKFIYCSGTHRNIIALGMWKRNDDEEKCFNGKGTLRLVRGQFFEHNINRSKVCTLELMLAEERKTIHSIYINEVGKKLYKTDLINDYFYFIKCIPHFFCHFSYAIRKYFYDRNAFPRKKRK